MGGNTSKGLTYETSRTGRLSPLNFHATHSENIMISSNKRCAKRVESFCKGICFSSRPTEVGEKIYIRFVETSTSWSGVLRFGFTSHDPNMLNSANLPRYACPDLTNKPGNWAKALGERYAEASNILCVQLTRNGDVVYSVNGEDKGVFFSGVQTNIPCWVLLDIYGNTVSVEFIDGTQVLPVATPPRNNATPRALHLPSVPELDRSLAAINIEVPPHNMNTPLKYHANTTFIPLPFDTTHGRNIHLSPDKMIAARVPEEYCNGFVFTSRPLRCGEKIVIQILGIEHVYVGGLAVGLTACNPSDVKPTELPDDSDNLLDRKEYWVVNKDVCSSADIGDELSFTLTNEGEVHYGKNGHHVAVLMHVDKTTPLWAFFDVYGNTQKIKMLGVARHTNPRLPPRRSPSENVLENSLNLRVELPFSNHGAMAPPRPPPINRSISASAAVSMTTNVSSDMAPTPPPRPPHVTQSLPTTPQSPPPADLGMGSECTVCFEKAVDCVLYTCGHMCMCYECAVMVKREKGALCPICRQQIKDVIKTYRT